MKNPSSEPVASYARLAKAVSAAKPRDHNTGTTSPTNERGTVPKLNKAKAKRVSAAEGQDFSPLPTGTYLGVLDEVESKEGQKAPYWVWVFNIVDPVEYANRKLWVNTSLSDDSEWKLNEVFVAFDVPPDTHTDDLIGKAVNLEVVQQIMTGGKMKGKLGNNVTAVLPADEAYDEDEEDEEETF